MANQKCKLNLKDGTSSKNTLKRNNYFKGKLLSAKDFLDEQDYLTDKIRLLSKSANGSGVIEGLKVEQTTKDISSISTADTISNLKRVGNSLELSTDIDINKFRRDIGTLSKNYGSIVLTSGAAIDTQGNLLFLNKTRSFKLRRILEKEDYIYLKYIERGNDKVSLQNEEECDDECCFNKIEEDFEIYLDKELLTLPAKNICTTRDKGTPNNPPLVLIGQYNIKGGFDYSNVKKLYKNSELSKRLCEISKKYVSSVNGETGDITTISSINNAVADNEGQVNLVAGNNISITSEGHDVTIASKNGYYHDYYITIEANSTYTLQHNAKRFPSVDVYRRSEFILSYTAIRDTDIRQLARDSKRAYDDVKIEMEALPLDKHIQQRVDNESVHESSPSMETEHAVRMMATPTLGNKKTTPINEKIASTLSYTGGKRSVGEALLGAASINSLSPALAKISDRELSKLIDSIYIVPNYEYIKIVGTQDPEVNITVTHLNRNSLKLKNNNMKENISLLVVLNT